VIALAIQALVISARKQGILDEDNLGRLGRRAERRGVACVADLRAWLTDSKDCTPRLAQQLLRLLPALNDHHVGENVLLTHLADGGMGRVYLAENPAGELVVVKTLRSEFSDNPRYAHRFKREVAITGRLDHPNLVKCLGHGQEQDGQLFLVLEYVPGGDLAALISRINRLPQVEALIICYQVAKAVAHAHGMSLIHRDIKPGNVFIASDGQAKLADFGLARSTVDSYSLNTIEGRAIGSPSFMSPEQVAGSKDIDTRADLYALGCVLYYLLVGHGPFTGQAVDIMRAQVDAPPPDVRTKRADVHERTAKTILKLLSKDPGRRYQTPQRLVESLNKTLRTLGVDPENRLCQETINLSASGTHAALQEPLSAPATRPATVSVPKVSPPAPSSARHTQPSTQDGLWLDPPTARATRPIAKPVADPSTRANEAAVARPPVPTHPSPRARAATPAPVLSARPSTVLTMPTPRPSRLQPLILVPTTGSEMSLTDQGLATVRDDGDRLVGLTEAAVAEDWLTLEGVDGSRIILLARSTIVVGKVREAPVDLTLRVYPLDQFGDECQRVSKSHFRLRCDRDNRTLVIEDTGSANGTILDGRMLNPLQPWPLAENHEHQLEIPRSIRMAIRSVPQRSQQTFRIAGMPPGGKGSGCGIDSSHVHDAVVLRRIDNRAEMRYAMVLRRVTVGGQRADLPVANWTGPDLDLARFAGRWIWRTVGFGAWLPVIAGSPLDSFPLLAKAGSYEDYR